MPKSHHHPSSSIDNLRGIPLTEVSPYSQLVPPEPTDTSSSDDNNESTTPHNGKANNSSSSVFNLSTLMRILTSIQKYSSYAFSSFLVLHLGSVVISPLISYETGNQAVLFTKTLYQSPAIEPIMVVGSLATHIATGITIRAIKMYRSYKHYDKLITPVSKPSPLAISGYLLTPLALGHFYMSRYLPEKILGDSSLISLDYIAHSIADHPASALGALTLLLSTGLYHTIYGFRRWFGIVGGKPKLTSPQNLTLYAGVICGIVSLAKIASKGPIPGWVGSQYDLIIHH